MFSLSSSKSLKWEKFVLLYSSESLSSIIFFLNSIEKEWAGLLNLFLCLIPFGPSSLNFLIRLRICLSEIFNAIEASFWVRFLSITDCIIDTKIYTYIQDDDSHSLIPQLAHNAFA